VTLYLTWNVIPNVGALPNVPADGKHRIAFPSEYASATSA
jgi:signal peptidase complex subunit 3